MIYSSVSNAVVSALGAETRSRAKGQSWQKLYDPTDEQGCGLESLFESKQDWVDRNHVDCWVAARLHHSLIPRHWHALVAKYSSHKGQKVDAIAHLKAVIPTPATQLFLFKAVTAWAIPKLLGVRPKPANSLEIFVPPDVPAWRRDALIADAVSAGKIANRKVESRAEDIIVLADSFYDMNTWDSQGVPESTRRRWRADIVRKLNGIVNEALDKAEVILISEGVLECR